MGTKTHRTRCKGTAHRRYRLSHVTALFSFGTSQVSHDHSWDTPPQYINIHTHTQVGCDHSLSSEVSAFSIVLYKNMDVSATECLLVVVSCRVMLISL